MTATLEDKDFVQEWLQHRAAYLPEADVRSVRVHDIRRLSRGVSRQTWSVDVSLGLPSGATLDRVLAIRRDHPDGSVIPCTLRTEFEIYHRLRGTGVPTSEALFFEDDPDWYPDGRPAYVRTMVEGHWYLPILSSDDPADDEAKIAASKEHLRKLAIVHSVDWRAQGLDEILRPPAAPEDSFENLLGVVLEQLSEFEAEASPLLAEGIAQLRAQAPDMRDVPVRLCKGTNGHGEEVWSNGTIVALSDWEMATIGDPAYDFAQIQEMVPEIIRDGKRLWGWPEALDYYRDISGIDIPFERISFYQRFYGLLQFNYTRHAAAAIRSNGSTNIRFTWNATEVGFRADLRIAQLFGVDLMKDRIA